MGPELRLEKMNIRDHLLVYVLASLAIALLLFEQSQLASRAGVQANVLGPAIIQQWVMAILILGLLIPAYAWTRRRWTYAVASILFAGYSGSRLAVAFTGTLELVPTLEARGIPISDYQGIFFVLALAAALSYVLMILLLRRSYRKLVQGVAMASPSRREDRNSQESKL